MISGEMKRLLPNAEKGTIAGATHDMWMENPKRCGQATIKFLARH
jgi:pimeloyl-ACP methyl ester carboxylesterase